MSTDATVSESKFMTVTKILGIITAFTVATFMYEADEYSGIDIAADTGLKRIETRVYYVLTTLSSVGYGDIYPVSTRARATACVMTLLMILSIV